MAPAVHGGAEGLHPPVVNLRGQPATKAEVVAEIRAVAAATRSPGPITGHSARVSGAQRLALAGVSEARITTFGRWSSAAFKLMCAKLYSV